MTRPAYTPTTELAYAALGPFTTPDEKQDWHLLHYVGSVADLLDPVEALARDTDDAPGWAVVMDPDTVPMDFLGWLGQFVGVRLLVGLDDASQRLRVRETAGFKRGTLAAIAGAARQVLTGSRQVSILERDGSPYRFRVRTYQAETPSAAAVRTAVEALKPAGLVVTYEVVTGATYAEMDTMHGTYADMDAAYTTYSQQTLTIGTL